MSSPDVLSFAFHQKPPLPTITTSAPFSLPSPPLSVSSDIPADAFDLDSLVDFASTPQSTTLVSPKTASAFVSPTSFEFDTAAAVAAADLFQQQQQQPPPPPAFSPVANNTADALSKHHFERYLHYRALAAQAEAELAFSLVDGQLMSNDEQPPASSIKDRNMLAALQPLPNTNSTQSSGTSGGFWNSQIFSYQHQQQQQVLQAQAQAHAHLQAAEVAQRMSMTNYYMAPAPPRPADALPQQPPPLWSRTSGTTSISGASPPMPSTPNYSTSSNAGMSTMPSFNASSNTATLSSTKQQSASVHSEDMEEDELETEDRLSSGSLPNMHGGGRGYVPGKTPDDPKKRHKCQVCGRGFARAFNLKSHVQTHDPLRPKPHQCPHPMCKRSFSRLHDLERHRQGIHSDGPLVDAKRQGVTPSVVRAQSRMQRRAETGGLI